MSGQERAKFIQETSVLAAALLARGEDLRTALSPAFRAALRQHPDEEDRLLELWDKLTSRPIL